MSSLRDIRYLFLVFLTAACGRVVGTSPAVGASPESGDIHNYGFISDFSLQTEEEVSSRVRSMMQDFDIRDFQFYDWFVDYSTPTLKGAESWVDPYFHQRPIFRTTIQNYIKAIHQRGGKAWAYVQALGSENPKLVNAEAGIFPLLDANGKWHWHEQHFPTYFANANWADHMVKTWAPAIKDLGFDGIHWDTLGHIAGDYDAEAQGFHEFIRKSYQSLMSLGLEQTTNFVDLAWWDDDLIAKYVKFPYAEIWSEEAMQTYFQSMDNSFAHRGVIVLYPSNKLEYRQSPAEYWRQTNQHRLSYMYIGDGKRHLVSAYLPNTRPLTTTEIEEFSKITK